MGMKMLLPTLFALPLLAACATTAGASAKLSGSSWAFTAIDGAAPKSDRARLEFGPDRISATVGCNGLGGDYAIENGRVQAGPFMSTMMFCEGLMEQERAVAKLLESKPTITFSAGKLVLEGGGHRAEFTRSE